MSLIPQLAESVDKKTLPTYVVDDRYYFEQKVDGHRKCIVVENSKVQVIGRDGQQTGLPMAHRFQLPGGWIFDGELVGDIFWVFDLVSAGNQVGPDDPYSWRRDVLDNLAPSLECDDVKVLPCARTTEEKLALCKQVIENGGEGIMIKDASHTYQSGKRHRGLLKAKFVKDVDAYITRFGVGLSSSGSGQPKANCELAVKNDNGDEVIIGECIIHPKERLLTCTYDEFQSGDGSLTCVVTVNYLYVVNPDKPRLVQPTRIRPRFDKAPDECLLSQLRFTDKSVIERIA